MSDGHVVESVLFLKPIGGDHSAIQRFFEEEQVLEHASRNQRRGADDGDGFMGVRRCLPRMG